MATTESLTVYPAEYLASESYFSSQHETKTLDLVVGMSAEQTTTTGIWYPYTTSNRESYVYYRFNLSAIPQDATIDSVACAVAYRRRAGSGAACYAQLACGTTVKGTADETPGTQARYTDLDCGTWTRSELDDCRVKFFAIGNGGSSVTAWVYGATLTVTYTYSNQTFMLKTNGVWTEVSAVYKKADGAWVEQEDLQNVFDTSTNYVRGVVT